MIHSTAIIDQDARLGANVQVGPYTCIERDVEIGDNCVIGPHAVIMRHTTLGAGCKVHAGAVLGDVPQDTGFTDCVSRVRIGVECVIREGVTVHRGTKPDSVTEVGDGCWLMAYAHLAHNVRLGKRVIVANGVLLAGYVTVGDGTFISGTCLVHQFCRIGRLVMVGGNAGLSKDVVPFCLVESGVVNRIAGLNVIGLRRAGFSPQQRQSVKAAYRVLFRSGRNLSEAVAEVRRTLPDCPLAAEMCDFIDGSARGVCADGGAAN